MTKVNKLKSALILGVTGQDGALLAEELLSLGYKVYGGFRRGLSSKVWRLEELGVLDQLEMININLHEPHQVMEAITTIQPDHIYHFAGESFVSDSFHQPYSNIAANTVGTLNVLEAIRISAPDARLFFASSSEIFGGIEPGKILTEESKFLPSNPYGVSKLAAQNLVNIYRNRFGVHAVCGIMFNHTGPLRARNFVTRKITYNLARLRIDGGSAMVLGNMEACRDWGSAADYVRSMPKVLAVNAPHDFIFATGKVTSVKTFLRLAAEAAGFVPIFENEGLSSTCRDKPSGQKLAEVSERYFRVVDTPPHVGSSARLKKTIDYVGVHSIQNIAEEMMKADLDRRTDGRLNV